jgi:hypothetical protein
MSSVGSCVVVCTALSVRNIGPYSQSDADVLLVALGGSHRVVSWYGFCSVVSSFVMNSSSPSNLCKRTPSMVYCPVLPGMHVTIETSGFRSPITGVDWPNKTHGI